MGPSSPVGVQYREGKIVGNLSKSADGHFVMNVWKRSRRSVASRRLTWQHCRGSRPVSAVDSGQRLRSAAQVDLIVDTFSSDFGQRSFRTATPRVWNELPSWLRNVPIVDAFN